MAIAAVGAGSPAPISQPAPKVDSPHDGDADDAAAPTPVQSVPALGTGTVVNKSA